MSRLFNLDFQLLHDSLLTLVAVFVLFLGGSFFFFNPARKFLEKRKQGIADDIEAARKEKEDAERLKTEYEDRLKNVDAEVEGILSDARQRALANENRIVADAREEAGKIIDNAHREANLEKLKVADEVKEEVINVAEAMAGKIVASSMSEADQKRLLDETLKGIGEDTWLNQQ
ncbi:MAG: F0F1 ATP synthase subunit B [Lachnospiraceae bacterium]|nr:F0F1 ATP synthase subunit B [Lachnospiraceae bacterium]